MREVNVSINEREQRFEVNLDGQFAVIEYVLKPDQNQIIFTHTEVPPEFMGHGIAAKLAKYALEFARTNKENS